MNLSLTNETDEPEAIGTPDGSWINVLTPGTTYNVDGSDEVVIIGDKLDVREQFEKAAGVISGMVKHLITIIAGRKQHLRDSSQPGTISVTILNRGDKSVRVILGDGVTDLMVDPGRSELCTAPGYLELRELGDAPQQGGTPT